MEKRLVECVPNFSEGRDEGKVRAIAGAIASVPGVVVLDTEMDADHHRSVITFVAPPDAAVEAALAGAAKAAELIDLNSHRGAHPRIGALDVLPFVPLSGVTMEECVKLAERAAAELWKRLRIPCYLYEAAARRPERVQLENIRRGQFEALREEMGKNPERDPDVGEPVLHPTAGATVVGARKFLIAYNILLRTSDLEVAKQIARAVRFSSGGFRFVKAMGVALESRGMVQVSMNLTDFESTPVHRVFETVKREAERYGVAVASSEIVGLIPKKAIEMTAEYYLQIENFQPSVILENRLAQAMGDRGGLREFLDALAAPSATPGGGSAAAAAGAMAAALGAMAARLARLDADAFEQARAFFTEAVDRDAAAFREVMAAYRRPKEERGPYVEKALRLAAEVPLEVFVRAGELKRRLEELKSAAPAKFGSDIATGIALAEAARAGARANVEINLEGLQDSDFKSQASAILSGGADSGPVS
ncbi:MAG: glutamate formimidoyltransferase [Bryobacteraceae bacterium]|nr:glutamate formimidoyltransferase [Bryobacteraceae bacterium]